MIQQERTARGLRGDGRPGREAACTLGWDQQPVAGMDANTRREASRITLKVLGQNISKDGIATYQDGEDIKSLFGGIFVLF